MSLIQIVPATDEHARAIAARLREADKIELGEHAPERLLDILLDAVRVSRWANAALLDGAPVLVYGVSQHKKNSKWGVPWLLGTDGIEHIRRRFVRDSQGEVDLMLARFSFLFNQVHDRNQLCIRWLMWLGFCIDFEHPVTHRGQTFLNFYRGNPHV